VRALRDYKRNIAFCECKFRYASTSLAAEKAGVAVLLDAEDVAIAVACVFVWDNL
jgi:hypothetical protein